MNRLNLSLNKDSVEQADLDLLAEVQRFGIARGQFVVPVGRSASNFGVAGIAVEHIVAGRGQSDILEVQTAAETLSMHSEIRGSRFL